MYSREELRDLIEKSYAGQALHKKPAELYQPISYMMQTGGKRLRPVLALMACNLFTDNIKDAVLPALGLEVFHNFTLVHDDIMDKADIRRNKETVHKKWDDNRAILSGDVMLIQAYEYIATSPAGVLTQILKLFNNTARQVCEGQQYDMNYESRDKVSEEEYLFMIENKTSVLLGASLQLGAIIARAPERDSGLLYDFGTKLGMAFQIQDDLLDSFGDPDIFGKETGGDIKSNKKTYLLIKAYELANAKQKDSLNRIIAGEFNTEKEKIQKVLAIYESLGIRHHATRKANEYLSSALDKLDMVDIASERKSNLKEFADVLKDRIN